VRLSRIAEVLGCTVPTEETDREVSGIASAECAAPTSVVFVSDPRMLDAVRRCPAEVAIAKPGTQLPGKIVLEVRDPYVGYARVAQLFEDRQPLFEEPVHPTASVHPEATLEPRTWVGPGCVVGKDCHIGAGTILGAHCIIENGTVIGEDCRIDSGVIVRRMCRVGNRVFIQSGTVVGSEGFGNALENGVFVRIPCFGTVEIEDDVEIGANCTIDRGNFSATFIRRGARIDNLVHIAHNCEVGEHSAFAAQVGVSGSTTIGKHVLVGGQAGFVGHIHVGDKAFIGAQAGVSKGVENGGKVTGSPARDMMGMRRIEAAQSRLPELIKEVKELRRRLDAMEGTRPKDAG
jgi:UDP-3-O-[3-hydroxymyristoyl] glucosamine N-acyltransferase